MKRNKVRIETILQVPEGVIVWVQAEAIQAAAVIQVAAEISGEAELREAGRKRRVFRFECICKNANRVFRRCPNREVAVKEQNW